MFIGSLSATLAYIGPGPGLSLTWALIALVGTVLSAVAAILFWPLKAMMRRLRSGEEVAEEAVMAEGEG